MTTGEREHRERIFSHPPFMFVLLLFLGWALISATWAEDPGAAIDTSPLLPEHDAVPDRLHGGPGRASTRIWVRGRGFVIGRYRRDRPAMLNPPTYEDDLTVRISGTIGDPNELAAAAGCRHGAARSCWRSTTQGKPLLRMAAGSAVVCSWSGSSTPSRAVA